MTQRIYGLELLRGLCALFVAIYHCMLWGNLAHLHSCGISGAVLYHSYHAKIGRTVSFDGFLLRRFARLAPLYALCTVVVAIGLMKYPSWRHLLNISLLFGFANPGQTSTVTGGWSLGIEFVLYTIFPLLLAFTTTTRMAIATVAVLFLLRIAFVEVGLLLVSSWCGEYINLQVFRRYQLWSLFVSPDRVECIGVGCPRDKYVGESNGRDCTWHCAGVGGSSLLRTSTQSAHFEISWRITGEPLNLVANNHLVVSVRVGNRLSIAL